MAISVELQSSCDPECLGKPERCFLGNSPGFWTECQWPEGVSSLFLFLNVL